MDQANLDGLRNRFLDRIADDEAPCHQITLLRRNFGLARPPLNLRNECQAVWTRDNGWFMYRFKRLTERMIENAQGQPGTALEARESSC